MPKCHPYSKIDLKAKLESVCKAMNNQLITTRGLRLYKLSTMKVHINLHPVLLTPREGQDQNIVLGHILLIKIVGRSALVFPPKLQD